MALRTDFENAGQNSGHSTDQITVQQTGDGPVYKIPLGSFILDADYARNGQDLVLSDDFGREVTVKGYFLNDELPPLQNEFGAKVLGGFVAKLSGPGQVAQSGNSVAALGEPVGTVENIDGNATVLHKDGTSEKLQTGSDIYQDDVIETDASGNVGILLKDGAIMGVGPGSRMTIDSFVYDAGTNDGNIGLSFLKGAVSFVSGKIAKNDYEDVNIKVPYGSIGIRGTEFVVETGNDGVATVFVLQGRVITLTGDQEVILTPGQLIAIMAQGLSPVQEMTLLQIQQQFQSIIRAQENTRTIRDGRGETNDEELNATPAAGGQPGENGEGGEGDGTGDDAGPQQARDEGLELTPYNPNLVATNVDGFDIAALFNSPAFQNAGLPFGNNPDLLTPEVGGVFFLGTEGDDYFVGTGFGDVLIGVGGNDSLFGGAGNDNISGGDGNDYLSGDEGDDNVDGGAGNDILQGGEGSVDILHGGDGDDLMYGDDALDPDPTTGDDDTLYGDAGNDTMYGGGGTDVMFGGAGNDLLVGGRGSDLLDGGDGDDIAGYDGSISDYSIQVFGDQFSVQDTLTGEIDLLNDIEKVRFDEGDFSLVTFSISGDANVEEGGTATYRIELGGTALTAGQTATVQISLVDIDTSSADYQNLIAALQAATESTPGVSFTAPGSITFSGGAGNASALEFTLSIPEEYEVEGAELFALQLHSPSGSGDEGNGVIGVIGTAAAVTEIADGVIPTPEWQITELSADPLSEGDTASYQISFTDGPIAAGNSFSIAVSFDQGTTEAGDLTSDLLAALADAADATPGVTLVGDRLYFDETAPNSLSFSLPISVDGYVEGDESFTISLQDPQVNENAIGTIAVSEQQTTIEAHGEIVFDISGAASVTEGGESALYRVAYDGAIEDGTTVSVQVTFNHISTSDADLEAFQDALQAAALATPGVSFDGSRLTFDASANSIDFDLQALIDGLAEGEESFSISLSDPQSTDVAVSIDGEGSSVQTIVTDIDEVVVTFSGDTVAPEGGVASYTISLSGAVPAGETVSVDISLSNDGASAADYQSLLSAMQAAAATTPGVSIDGNTVVFDSTASSFTFDMSVLSGDGVEGAEAFNVAISNAETSNDGAISISGPNSVKTDIIETDSLTLGFTQNYVSKLEGQTASYTILLGGLAAGMTALPAGAEISFNLDLNHLSTEDEDIVGMLQAALGDLPAGVTIDGSDNSLIIRISDEAVFTDGEISFSFDLETVAEDGADGDESFTIDISNIAASGVTVSAGDLQVVTDIEDDGITPNTPTPFDDVLVGTDGDDYIDALSGDDHVSGGDGDDTLLGNTGSDTLVGGNGFDSLMGGSGNDYLVGGAGNDTLNGGTGNDYLDGGSDYNLFFAGEGEDTLIGGAEGDAMYGDGGDDLFYAMADDDTLYGGSGSDMMYGGDGGDRLYGENGNDTLSGDGGNDSLYGGAGNDSLLGGAGADTLDGGAGSDVLEGGDGDDLYILRDGYGNDLVNDSSGSDRLLVENFSHVVRDGDNAIFYTSGGAQVTVQNYFTTSTVAFGSLEMGNWNFDLSFEKSENGGGTDDLIIGSDASVETLSGGGGDDLIFAGLGDDVMYGDAGNDILIGGVGNDTIFGGDGYDTILYNAADQSENVVVDLQLGLVSNDGYGGVDRLENVEAAVGGDLNDSLTGSDDANLLIGGAGNDYIYGRGGDDTIDGGTGDNSLIGGTGYNTVTYENSSFGINLSISDEGITVADHGDGIDSLDGFDRYIASHQADILTGSSTNEELIGLGGNDSIFGGSGQDSIDGGMGQDTLDGGAGYDLLMNYYSDVGVQIELSDWQSGTINQNGVISNFQNFETYAGSQHSDLFRGSSAGDRFAAGLGDDTLLGEGGFDYLNGDGGNDLLVGGNGNDTLVGGDGFDTMTGGADTDFFDFNAFEEGSIVSENGTFSSEHDVISDFQTGTDILRLAGDVFDFDGVFDASDDFVMTIGGQAYDGTNADLSAGQDTGEAKLIFDGTYLYYDNDLQSDGYTVIAEIGSGTIAGDDVSVTASAS